MYDVTKSESKTGLEAWVKELKLHGPTNCNIVMVANKVDLIEEFPIIDEYGEAYASKIKALHWQTSAKTSYNVDQLFKNITEIVDKRFRKRARSSVSLDPIRHKPESFVDRRNKTSCC